MRQQGSKRRRSRLKRQKLNVSGLRLRRKKSDCVRSKLEFKEISRTNDLKESDNCKINNSMSNAKSTFEKSEKKERRLRSVSVSSKFSANFI